MSLKLSAPQSFALYGVAVVVIWFFFGLGLFVGKNYFVKAGSPRQSSSESPPPVPDVKPDLEFYEELTLPSPQREAADQAVTPEPVSGGGSTDSAAAGREETVSVARTATPAAKELVQQRFTIQLGALSKEKDARRLLQKLEDAGYSGRLQRPGPGSPLHRVYSGEFATREEASQLKSRLDAAGFPNFINSVPPPSP